MLSARERVKSYIGMDVMLVKCPDMNSPAIIEIVVGHLNGYYYLAQDLPFGTAVMLGATKFSINVNTDEFRQGRTSWTFSWHEALKEWVADLPKSMDFLEAQLPAGSIMEDIHGVTAIAPLKPGMLTKYIEKANELFEIDDDTPPTDL